MSQGHKITWFTDKNQYFEVALSARFFVDWLHGVSGFGKNNSRLEFVSYPYISILMKTAIRILLPVLLVVGGFFIYSFATNDKTSTEGETAESAKLESDLPGEDFNKYWYAGEAELNSYELDQARYGEMRGGEAVLVFVAEDFSDKALTKYDGRSGTKVPVLKVNFDKKFLTGIYPY